MKCIVPNQNVKIIARAIHSLSKIGDEMFIEPTGDELVMRTVNMAQSAFAEFKMTQSFFSYYTFSDPEDCDSSCKITMRSCLNVFKNLNILDKQIENCEIRMKPEATVIIFQLKFSNTPVKKYYLPVIESEKLEANVPTENLNRITASSKMLMSTIKNFRYSEDEITITVKRDKTIIKNHVEIKKDASSMRTELSFHPSEFEAYSVTNPACITFCFKELRAVLSFAEPTNLSVSMLFTSPGKPILFQVSNIPAYEASYVVSTLNTNAANLETSLSLQTRLVNVPQTSDNTNTPRQSSPYNFAEEGIDAIQQDSVNVVNNNTLPKNIENRPSGSSLIAVNNKKQTVSVICHELNSSQGRKRKNSDLESSLCLSDGIESMYSSNFNSNPGQPKLSVDASDKISSTNSSTLSESSELVKIVFSRCFRSTNMLDNLSGHEVVLSEPSDVEAI